MKTAGNVNWTDDSGDGFKERLLDVSTSPFAPKLIAGSGGGEPVNAAPKASFTSSCSRLDCTFTSTSTDVDGSIVGWEWKFGDGVTDTVGAVVKHTYLSPGTYRVELVVTDNRGATSTFSQNVTVKNRGGK